jgi:large subunit ribosomal protein L13
MSMGPSYPTTHAPRVLNASGKVVGRLAAQIAVLVMGKHKPTFSPNLDHGDNVFLVNSNEIRFTGDKYTDKRYIWHTGWPGGLRQRSPKEFAERHGKPEEIMLRAVSGMLPKNKLRSQRMHRLTLFPGTHKELADMFPHLAAEARLAAEREGVPFDAPSSPGAADAAAASLVLPARFENIIKQFSRANVSVLRDAGAAVGPSKPPASDAGKKP